MNRLKAYLNQMKGRDWAVNLLLYLIGIGLMPFGVVLTINSHLGAGGYDALNFALGDRLGINTSYAKNSSSHNHYARFCFPGTDPADSEFLCAGKPSAANPFSPSEKSCVHRGTYS